MTTAQPSVVNYQGNQFIQGMDGLNNPNSNDLVYPNNILPQNQPTVQNSEVRIVQNHPTERHRRSKHELEGRIYQCECGKSYLSQPALNNHKKTKHPELNEVGERRGRGRPRKYLPNLPGDFETNKYENFFNVESRKKPENASQLKISAVCEDVFNFLFKGENKEKTFSKPEKLEDNPLLKNLKENAEIVTKDRKERVCDEIFYEYLKTFKDSVNETYLKLLLKFVLLFRECFNSSKGKSENKSTEASKEMKADTLPEMCNEFYTNYLESNGFFGLDKENEKAEIIDLIQHFCIWLFKNEYTK